jgi:hypothetical protein
MPMIATTMSNSIRVKPRCLLFSLSSMFLLLAQAGYITITFRPL